MYACMDDYNYNYISLEIKGYDYNYKYNYISFHWGAATQALLNRGARLTEVLKQPQYTPLPIEKEILVIYAAVNGFCDRMPLDRISQYERIITSVEADLETLWICLRMCGGELQQKVFDAGWHWRWMGRSVRETVWEEVKSMCMVGSFL